MTGSFRSKGSTAAGLHPSPRPGVHMRRTPPPQPWGGTRRFLPPGCRLLPEVFARSDLQGLEHLLKREPKLFHASFASKGGLLSQAPHSSSMFNTRRAVCLSSEPLIAPPLTVREGLVTLRSQGLGMEVTGNCCRLSDPAGLPSPLALMPRRG